MSPALAALRTLAAVAARDAVELNDALCDLDQRHERHERKRPGQCAQGACTDRCPGVITLKGCHCPECKRVLRAEWCELDTLRNGSEIVRARCPCGEITVHER